MTEQKATNITWHRGAFSRDQRAEKNRHRGALLWFTGLSGSGKSTLAFGVENALSQRGCQSYVLDGDNVRHGLNKDLTFSEEDRIENIRRIGEVAHLFVDAGMITLAAFISPYQKDRSTVRSLHDAGEFIEIHCACELSTLEERDPKGLYKKARAGEITNFTGIDAPYEAPESPEIIVDTGNDTIEDNVATIVQYLETSGILMG